VSLVREIEARVDRLEVPFQGGLGPKDGYDKYGTSKRHLTLFFTALGWMYRNYLRVTVKGIENVPKRGRAMIVGNHSGGYAVDGAMVLTSMLLEMDPPRLAQGMAEKFLNAWPVSSLWTSRVGQLTGLPEHAERLLLDDRLLMVFPEGARGTAKLYKERYNLIDFGTGFMRLAQKTKTPIIPFAFVGGGDVVPTVMNLYKLGQLFGVPYVPVTAYGLPLPLPRPCQIIFGEPMHFEGRGDEEDAVVGRDVARVKLQIGRLLDEGRRAREGK
jgi:1-acyl-sn-glycerol-3-phosphate acyltransferase